MTTVASWQQSPCTKKPWRVSVPAASRSLLNYFVALPARVQLGVSAKNWYNPIQLAVHFHTYNCTHFVKKYIPWKMKNSKRIKTAFSRSYQFSHFSFTLKLYKIPCISLYEIEKSFPYSRIKKNILCPFSFHRLSLFFTLWLL